MSYEPTEYVPNYEPTEAVYPNPYEMNNPLTPPPPPKHMQRRWKYLIASFLIACLIAGSAGFIGYILGVQSVNTKIPYQQGYSLGQNQQESTDTTSSSLTQTAAYNIGEMDQSALDVSMADATATAAYNQGYQDSNTAIINGCAQNSAGHYEVWFQGGQLWCYQK